MDSCDADTKQPKAENIAACQCLAYRLAAGLVKQHSHGQWCQRAPGPRRELQYEGGTYSRR